ncbi:H-NS family nucleoid-associated regulatory protein [Paraburkholderia sp. J94]|uniref:H-NS family nucleoid-associated regulatory protein n=1 Tax=Paraburkholderia sp. J94 TaxID=2805441 RepID=UPI002AB0F8A9|nr:H-NS family nucleoid-associated regulatory protein [Paraburkholderia sp. J94]
MSASKPTQPAPAPEPPPGLKQLRAELGQVNDRLADARAREAAAALARFREEVALLGITEQEVRRALGYDRPARLPAKYYDPVTGSKWSGKGKRPRWLVGKRLEDYAIDAPQPQAWWPGEK